MTLLASWMGIDSRGAVSAYIASDSRITWGGTVAFDYTRKVFAFRHSPDILGYAETSYFRQ
jgi:hypothetical protein